MADTAGKAFGKLCHGNPTGDSLICSPQSYTVNHYVEFNLVNHICHATESGPREGGCTYCSD